MCKYKHEEGKSAFGILTGAIFYAENYRDTDAALILAACRNWVVDENRARSLEEGLTLTYSDVKISRNNLSKVLKRIAEKRNAN